MLGNGNTVVVELAEALAAGGAGRRPALPVRRRRRRRGRAGAQDRLPVLGQPGRRRAARAFLALGDAYHGDTIGSLSLGDGGVFSAVFEPLCFPVLRTPGYADPGLGGQGVRGHRGPRGRARCRRARAAGAGCVRACCAHRLGSCARSARRADATTSLLVCDEVATGFGRTGTLFASEQCGLRPDLLCLGKGITGGYLAMSATVASGRGVRRLPRTRPRAGDLLPRALLRRERAGGRGGARAPAPGRGVGRAGQRARAGRPAGGAPRRAVRRAGRRCTRSASGASWSASSWTRRDPGCAGADGSAPGPSPGACCCARSATWWC